MSVPKKTGDQIVDAITFAIFAKHLSPDADPAGFEFWLDKCLDFDAEATLRWIKKAEANKRLTPEQQAHIAARLRVRPKLQRVAVRAGIVATGEG